MSDDRTKKAKRLQRTSNAIKKQLTIAKNVYACNEKFVEQPHRLAKHHLLDCGNPECLVCHSEKVFGKPSFQERKFMQGSKDEDS